MDVFALEKIEADRERVSELMTKIEPLLKGYSRMIVALACARIIAAMFGPAKIETREHFLQRFPGYMRSMWNLMDEIVQ